MVPAGAPVHSVSGLARSHLLGGLRRASRIRPGHQPVGAHWRIEGPIVIGRDHLDTGSAASSFRETECMPDGSDAIADWPLLNALVNTAAGANWVSIHNGGEVGIGYSQHAGTGACANLRSVMRRRLERVLTSDPGLGVVRHADAGYPEAIRFAETHGIQRPGL